MATSYQFNSGQRHQHIHVTWIFFYALFRRHAPRAYAYGIIALTSLYASRLHDTSSHTASILFLMFAYILLRIYASIVWWHKKEHHNGVLLGKLWTSDLFTAISCSSTLTCCILTWFGFGSTSCRTASFCFATSFTSCHISTSYFKDKLHNGFVF